MKRYWYSIEELASKWDCSTDDVIHLAKTGKLEICFNWKALAKREKKNWVSIYFLEHTPDFFAKSDDVSFYYNVADDIEFEELGKHGYLSYLLDLSEIKKAKESGFAVFYPKDNGKNSPLAQLVAIDHNMLLDFNGETIELELTSDATLPNPVGYLSCYSLIIKKSSNFEPSPIFIEIDDLIITDEEKSRIEKISKEKETMRHEVISNQSTVMEKTTGTEYTLPYSTDLLSVLIASMTKCFPEDRKNDPPKSTVIEEMMKIAKDLGVDLSQNVANSMFTIIMPKGHNPKKYRDSLKK